VPEAEPKLVVMSRRTTPLSLKTFGPFEPSPGNGPAVSSGIGVDGSDVLEEIVPEGRLVVVVPPPVLSEVVRLDDAQPTSVTTPAPAISLSRLRRRINGDRSREESASSSSMPPP
jgi:hypothetical protein